MTPATVLDATGGRQSGSWWEGSPSPKSLHCADMRDDRGRPAGRYRALQPFPSALSPSLLSLHHGADPQSVT